MQKFNMRVSVQRLRDNKEKLRLSLKKALETNDLLFLSGGVSMGEKDLIPELLEELQVQKIFHKLQIKPGKPVYMGHREKKVIFALPGNPFSCQVLMKILVEPFLRKSYGLPQMTSFFLPLSQELRKKGLDKDEFLPCQISPTGNLIPVSFKGSGDIKAALNSHGLFHHPAERQTLKRDENVLFFPWRSFS